MFSITAGGGVENIPSTHVESANRVRTSVCAFTLEVSHAPILVECLFSTTLLHGCSPASPGESSHLLAAREGAVRRPVQSGRGAARRVRTRGEGIFIRISAGGVPAAVDQARQGRGGLENKHSIHSTDVEYIPTLRVCASVRAFTLKVTHAPMLVRVLVLIDPPARWTSALFSTRSPKWI